MSSMSEFFVTITHEAPHVWSIQTTANEDNGAIGSNNGGRTRITVQGGSGLFTYWLWRLHPLTLWEEVHLQETATIEVAEPFVVLWQTQGRTTIRVDAEDDELGVFVQENLHTRAALCGDQLEEEEEYVPPSP